MKGRAGPQRAWLQSPLRRVAGYRSPVVQLRQALDKLHGDASVKVVTFLDKPAGRGTQIDADYVGFTIPDAFVIGYGLDFAEKYRNIPEVQVLSD